MSIRPFSPVVQGIELWHLQSMFLIVRGQRIKAEYTPAEDKGRRLDIYGRNALFGLLWKLSLRNRVKGTGPLTAYCQRNSNLFHGIRWVFTSFGKEPDEILACVG
ncbi:hypothetical protein AAC387_Pa04g1706 [Persea americana]